MAFFDFFSNRDKMQDSSGNVSRTAQQLVGELNRNFQQDFGGKPEKDSEMAAFLETIEKEVKKRAKELAEAVPEKEEEAPKMDAAVLFYISEDRMSAYACMLPPLNEGKKIDRERFFEDMRYEGISSGIDDREIMRLINGQSYLHIINIARGTEPQDGEGGRVEELFERRQKRAIDIAENASYAEMDFREQGLMQPIRKGDVICHILPPVPPKDGVDVTGRTLKGKGGEAARIPAGENISVQEDGERLLAAVDGILVVDGENFSVLQQEIVEKDIDGKDGNQEFRGDVFIRGTIDGDVTVKAAGNIMIDGEVRSGRVISGGTIQIYQGVKGTPRTELRAERQIQCPVIENAVVAAKGNIYAGVIANSTVMSDEGSVYAMLDRGLIFGGEIRVNKSVYAKKIGNISGCANKILLGYVPELTQKMADMEKEMQEDRAVLDRLRRTISNMRAAGVENQRDKRDGYAKLMEQRTLYEERDKKREQELKDLKREVNLARTGKIRCEEIHPVTEIRIGLQELTIQKEEKNCNIHMYAGRIALK